MISEHVDAITTLDLQTLGVGWCTTACLEVVTTFLLWLNLIIAKMAGGAATNIARIPTIVSAESLIVTSAVNTFAVGICGLDKSKVS